MAAEAFGSRAAIGCCGFLFCMCVRCCVCVGCCTPLLQPPSTPRIHCSGEIVLLFQRTLTSAFSFGFLKTQVTKSSFYAYDVTRVTRVSPSNNDAATVMQK